MKTLTTIANVIVTESTTLDFAVDIIYKDKSQSITGNTTVVNTDAHGEDRGIVVGLVMSKYTWDKENVRIHPVARDINTGRFVSLKTVKEELVEEAKKQASDLLAIINEENIEDTQVSIPVASISKNDVEEIKEEVLTDIPATEECVEEILPPISKTVPTARRLKGAMSLPVVEFKVEPTVIKMEQPVLEVQYNMEEVYFQEPMYMDEDMSYEDLLYVSGLSDEDFEHEVNMDMSSKELTKQELVRRITTDIYRYFQKDCTLKSMNPSQIRDRIAYVYRNRMQDLLGDADLVGKVIKYILNKINSSMEAKRCTYLYKSDFMTVLTEACKASNHRASL